MLLKAKLMFWITSVILTKSYIVHIFYFKQNDIVIAFGTVRKKTILFWFGYLTAFGMKSNYVKKLYFGYIWYPEQISTKIHAWTHLLSWAKPCKTTYLDTFVILSKSLQNFLFEHICYSEQTGTKTNICSLLLTL